MHLSEPFATLYTKKGALRRAHRPGERFELTTRMNGHGGTSSKIPSMTIGEVRQCFMQIRLLKDMVNMETILFNGMPAGKFAIDYILYSTTTGNHAHAPKTTSKGREPARP